MKSLQCVIKSWNNKIADFSFRDKPLIPVVISLNGYSSVPKFKGGIHCWFKSGGLSEADYILWLRNQRLRHRKIVFQSRFTFQPRKHRKILKKILLFQIVFFLRKPGLTRSNNLKFNDGFLFLFSVAVDPCQNASCSHTCKIENKKAVCECPKGYRLDSADQKTCVGKRS